MTQPLASPARMRNRHWGVLASFVMFVIAPVLVAGWYLYSRAVDQYVSYVAFTVRSEDVVSAIDMLGGLGNLGGGGSSDSDILYKYIQSAELVSHIDNKLDLRSLYSAPQELDPVFAFSDDGTIEDLTDYWGRMVKIFYDSSAELIELRVHAFDPEDARRIAQAIFDDSSKMINGLSAIAREDATRYAREELDRAVERLKIARQEMTEFRSRNQIVDPEAEVGIQTGLMTALQSQLSDALIAYDLLRDSVEGGSARLSQAENRITAIEQRIEEERQKYSSTGAGSSDYSNLVGEFEGLMVNREFAEQAYLAALANYDGALMEAQRQSRYLAAYIAPTLAERAEYPQRFILMALCFLFLLFAWTIGVLIFYAIKDRR
ncbi:sugar transporter [Palleronia caenipelagi]|uniref:Sugar transporter n=1 Tax=Palleronia caenipelagi TaxID=2489174 RepID=A0A547PMW5_9RHOB|nr:sugar transporter [Palleronia caenipelagi]TRD15445.1 sugar transporter [Palleronia caenipelagi]